MFREPEIHFLDSELEAYAQMSYQDLMKLEGRVVVDSPDNLQGRLFNRHIRKTSNGSLEVRMLWILERAEGVTEEQLSNAIDVTDEDFVWPDDIDEDGEIEFLESATQKWFTMDSSNRIEWPSFDHEDDD